jgi:hypothetical protein
MTIQSPWAVLLCKFNDDDSDPLSMDFYGELFTSAGNGRFGMVDFLKSSTHGALDASGTQLFPNIMLPMARADYLSSGTIADGRNALIATAKAAASAAGINLSLFYNVFVCMNVQTDLCGGVNGVICDPAIDPRDGVAGLSPSLLGQEMLHGYGLQHSRHDGSEADYGDDWDVMSTKGPYMAPHPFWHDPKRRFVIGPGLNAANADAQGWLAGRIWTSSNSEYTAVVQLRPLFRDDLPGWAGARVGAVYFEYRTQEAWDAAIPNPCVLAHTFSDTHSYIMDTTPSISANGLLPASEEFFAGSSYDRGSSTGAASLGPWTRVDVVSIEAEVATLSIHVHADHRPVVGPGSVFGGIAQDGGGILILNGKVIRIPPRSPEEGLVSLVAQLAAAREIAPQLQGVARRAALVSLSAQVQNEMASIDAFRSPNLSLKAKPESVE